MFDQSNRFPTWIMKATARLDDVFDIRWRALRKRLGIEGIPQIQPYVGYASGEFVWVHGRVLTNPPVDLPTEQDRWHHNVVNTYRRFASDEVAGVEVEMMLGEQRYLAVTDHEGYFHFEVPHALPDDEAGFWRQVVCRITNSSLVSPDASLRTVQLMRPPSKAEFGVISDVDDTVIHTGATQLTSAILLTFLHNARTRVPLDGVGEFYHALQAGSVAGAGMTNPIFYVSSSPWNLFDVIEDIFSLNEIPLGPILLRDLGFDDNKFLGEGHEHKLAKTRRILAAYPSLPFVLVGDSGQDDASLYAQAAVEFGPSRISAIYIRDVDPNERTRYDERFERYQKLAANVGVDMLLVPDSREAALDAAQRNLIHPSRLSRIAKDAQRDQIRDALI